MNVEKYRKDGKSTSPANLFKYNPAFKRSRKDTEEIDESRFKSKIKVLK